jgi:hypothetical protein
MERDNRRTWKRRLGSMARSLDASAHVGEGVRPLPTKRRSGAARPGPRGACSGTSSVVSRTGPASRNLVTLYLRGHSGRNRPTVSAVRAGPGEVQLNGATMCDWKEQ